MFKFSFFNYFRTTYLFNVFELTEIYWRHHLSYSRHFIML